MIISILVTFTHNYNIYPQVMGQPTDTNNTEKNHKDKKKGTP